MREFSTSQVGVETRGGYYRKTILHRSIVVPHILWAEAMAFLCSGLSFQGCLYSKQPWKIKTVSPSGAKGKFVYVNISLQSKGQICLLLIIKDLRLSISTHDVCRHPSKSICTPVRLGPMRIDLNMLILMLLVILWVIKSFASNPGVSCLLPASINWQAKFLACK